MWLVGHLGECLADCFLTWHLPFLGAQPCLSHLGRGNLFLCSPLQLGNPVLLGHGHLGYLLSALP